MWDCLLLFQPAPLGIPASTQHLDASLVAPSVHDDPDHIPAYVRTEPLQIRNSEWALYVCQGVFDQAGFGSARGSFSPCTIFELAVSPAQGRKKIVEPWHDIMSSLMPGGGTHFQTVVIALFGFFHQPFEAHVASNPIPVMIEREEGQEARHPSIAVAKRVNAKEVQNRARDRQLCHHLTLVCFRQACVTREVGH